MLQVTSSEASTPGLNIALVLTLLSITTYVNFPPQMREMDPASDLELIHYYKGRTVWLVQPDLYPNAISPYPMARLENAESPQTAPPR